MTTDSDKQIDSRFFLLLIPAAYISYLFHELGHWSVGELLGNKMAYSLNYAWPKSGVTFRPDLYCSITVLWASWREGCHARYHCLLALPSYPVLPLLPWVRQFRIRPWSVYQAPNSGCGVS